MLTSKPLSVWCLGCLGGSIAIWLGLVGAASASPFPTTPPSPWMAQSHASQETSPNQNRRLAVSLVQQGIEQARRENYDRAIAKLRAATETLPDWAGAHYNLGVALGLAGDWPGAIDSYTRAIELNDRLVAAYVNRGLAKASRGDFASAIADYDEAIDLDRDRVLAYYNRGVAKAALARRTPQKAESLWQAAIENYSQAIKRDTTLTDAYMNRGVAYFYLREYVEAIADYTSVIFRNPQSMDAYYNRGLTYVTLGWRQEAIADFRQASQLALQANQPSRYRQLLQQLRSLVQSQPENEGENQLQ